MLLRMIFCLLPSAFCVLVSAADTPSDEDVKAAVDRAQAVRAQKALLP